MKKKADPFYKSTAWKKCRETILTRDHYLCQPCLRRGKLTTANTAHHIKPLAKAPDLALDEDNLESICPTCHNQEHPERAKRKKDEKKKEKRRARVIKIEGNRVDIL
ncbi:HNH endonuclease [Marininema halotolerans]|uniref:HNH endonuclease n=1 Tax=Marininema halotolerans TaxID=1155944 RepID=UPI000B892A96|nr:HNH endonuclease signature motif containing protein [Marininema halotolerans]